MNNSTSNFISNAGKATQKPEVFYDAFTGKKELDVSKGEIYLALGAVAFCIFCMWLSV